MLPHTFIILLQKCVFAYIIPVQAIAERQLGVVPFLNVLHRSDYSSTLWGEPAHVDGIVRWVETLSSKGRVSMCGSVCV